jgi:hypothetical protein
MVQVHVTNLVTSPGSGVRQPLPRRYSSWSAHFRGAPLSPLDEGGSGGEAAGAEEGVVSSIGDSVVSLGAASTGTAAAAAASSPEEEAEEASSSRGAGPSTEPPSPPPLPLSPLLSWLLCGCQLGTAASCP